MRCRIHPFQSLCSWDKLLGAWRRSQQRGLAGTPLFKRLGDVAEHLISCWGGPKPASGVLMMRCWDGVVTIKMYKTKQVFRDEVYSARRSRGACREGNKTPASRFTYDGSCEGHVAYRQGRERITLQPITLTLFRHTALRSSALCENDKLQASRPPHLAEPRLSAPWPQGGWGWLH